MYISELRNSYLLDVYENDVLLQVKRGEYCVEFKTSSRIAGCRRRFLCDAKTLRDWVDSYIDRPFYDQDCGNILKISYGRNSYTYCIEIWWVSDSNGRFTGFHQRMILSAEEFTQAISSTEWRKFLCKQNDEATPPVYIWKESSREVLHRIAENKLIRRAFCKSWARGMLNWPNTTIRFYNDGGYDFYFIDDSGINGGVICHKSKTRNGYDKYEYASHT